MNKKWEYYQIDESKIEEISRKYNISPLLSRILLNRNIDLDEKIKKFLYPKIEDLYDPFLMSNMETAVNRIIQAVNKKEKITIYGDYDVDGITSVAVLTKFLTELGVDNSYYLPSRLDEGYGLNNAALDKICSTGTKLVITVDCGISAVKEIDYAKEIGLDVIITDHHECPNILPNAYAIIDPKKPNEEYPCNFLAGVGVTFKLIHAISLKLNLDRKRYLKYLDLVCLGTVSDIVPILDENRVIVKYGLELIKVTKNIGLKSLINIAAYKEINSTAISFGLAPRINASGRMGEAEIALKMLLTNDEEEANNIAIKLNDINKERQNAEKAIIEEVINIIERDKLYNDEVIVLGNENWHHGVIGIVASKITEIYYKPSVLICFEGKEGKGSGRSIDGFDLYEALNACADTLLKYGGHEMAIGLSLEKINFKKFKKRLLNYANENMHKENIPTIKVDAIVSTKDISVNTIKDLNLLEPYGESNSAPIFVYKNVKVDSVRTLSNDRHLKLNIKDGNIIFDAIGFNMGNKKDSIKMGSRVDILHYIEINTYNGHEFMQLNMKDIKRAV